MTTSFGKRVEINIGFICNNNCLFCMSGENTARRFFVDFETVVEELKSQRKKGYDSVGFLGGEITIYPKVLALIKETQRIGYKDIHIITNARKFKDFEFLREMVNNGITRISVSMHSHEKEVENLLNDRPSYDEQLAGLKNLVRLYNSRELRDRVAVNIVINKLNYRQLDNTIKFFYSLGIVDFRLNFIWLEGNALYNKDDIMLRYNDIRPYIKKWYLLSKYLPIYISLESVPFCILGNKDVIDKLYGEFRDCATDVISDQKRKLFNWQERKSNKLKEQHLSCESCLYKKQCDGVWKNYIKYYGWEEFVPITK